MSTAPRLLCPSGGPPASGADEPFYLPGYTYSTPIPPPPPPPHSSTRPRALAGRLVTLYGVTSPWNDPSFLVETGNDFESCKSWTDASTFFYIMYLWYMLAQYVGCLCCWEVLMSSSVEWKRSRRWLRILTPTFLGVSRPTHVATGYRRMRDYVHAPTPFFLWMNPVLVIRSWAAFHSYLSCLRSHEASLPLQGLFISEST